MPRERGDTRRGSKDGRFLRTGPPRERPVLGQPSGALGDSYASTRALDAEATAPPSIRPARGGVRTASRTGPGRPGFSGFGRGRWLGRVDRAQTWIYRHPGCPYRPARASRRWSPSGQGRAPAEGGPSHRPGLPVSTGSRRARRCVDRRAPRVYRRRPPRRGPGGGGPLREGTPVPRRPSRLRAFDGLGPRPRRATSPPQAPGGRRTPSRWVGASLPRPLRPWGRRPATRRRLDKVQRCINALGFLTVHVQRRLTLLHKQ